MVRNFSSAGALLEFDGQMPIAARFRLIIDEYEFEVACYVKHRSRLALGVYFSEFDENNRPTGKGSAANVVSRAYPDH